MTHLQEFLRKHSGKANNIQNAINQLTEKLAIKTKRHSKFPNLVLFKYSMIDSPMANEVVRECRGIILDQSNDWAVVSRPYDKFFNVEEGHAAPINWNFARVMCKLDGSIFPLYNYNNRWHCSTSGMPDAAGQVHGFDFSFKQLFWNTWNKLGYKYPDAEDTDLTFIFEMCSKYNKVVITYEEPRLVLHGVRNRVTGQEFLPEPYCEKYGWECIETFPLTTKEEVLEAVCRLNGLEQEGFVVLDTKTFARVKIKCARYLAYASLKEGFSIRSLLDNVRLNNTEEIISYFTEWKDDFIRVKAAYDNLITECENFYNQIKDIADQKEFALKATTKPYSGVLFALRKGQCTSVREAFVETDIKKLEQMLNIENVQLSNI